MRELHLATSVIERPASGSAKEVNQKLLFPAHAVGSPVLPKAFKLWIRLQTPQEIVGYGGNGVVSAKSRIERLGHYVPSCHPNYAALNFKHIIRARPGQQLGDARRVRSPPADHTRGVTAGASAQRLGARPSPSAAAALGRPAMEPGSTGRAPTETLGSAGKDRLASLAIGRRAVVNYRSGRTPSDRPARRTRPVHQITVVVGTRRLRHLCSFGGPLGTVFFWREAASPRTAAGLAPDCERRALPFERRLSLRRHADDPHKLLDRVQRPCRVGSADDNRLRFGAR